MDFDLSEEQRLLKESIDGLLTDSYDFDARKKYQKEKGGWSKAVWNKLAEQGLLGLPFAEADGGIGAGAVETMIVMEALGTFSPLVEPLSLDEAFLDMTGSTRLFGTPAAMGARIKTAVRECTGGLTASVGISGTRYVAKVASGSSYDARTSACAAK